jgi:hypothetical protein
VPCNKSSSALHPYLLWQVSRPDMYNLREFGLWPRTLVTGGHRVQCEGLAS